MQSAGNNRKWKLASWFYLSLATLIYGSYWSYISIAKLLSLHAYVLDLGISAERGWQIINGHSSLAWYANTLINSAIVFPMSPLTSTGNYYAMLTFQAFLVALVGPALYRITILRGMNRRIAVIVSTAFFLYYPVYGIFWYDFHYQVIFFPLFIFAYMFYLEKRYLPSLILFILSGMVRYPYSIFPLAFATIELLPLLVHRKFVVHRKKTFLILILITVMAIWTALGYFTMGLMQPIALIVQQSFAFNSQGEDSRILSIFLIISPLLMLPLLSIRWAVLVIPAFYLMIFSSNVGYTFPFILHDQYISGIAPFLLLGFIDSLALIFSGHRSPGMEENPISNRSDNIRIIRIAAVIFTVLVILNSVYAPFGPYNGKSQDNFNMQLKTEYNLTHYSELMSMINLIPRSDPYVAFQDNLPQVLPRPLPDGGALLIGGYLGSFSSFTNANATSNLWPIVTSTGKITSIPLDYAIADASNPNFYYGPNSMYSIVSTMYSSGNYGILSEGYGMILLKQGYNGSIVNYVPELQALTANKFTNYSGNYSGSLPIIKSNDRSNGYMFYGPGTYLFPGSYTATFYLRTSNLSENNTIWLQVTSNGGNKMLSFREINGSSFNAANQWQEFNLTFHTDNIWGNVEFRGFGIQWTGVLEFNGVVLKQNSAFQNTSAV